MADGEERVTGAKSVRVTPERLRGAAAEAELRGDWEEAALLVSVADRLIMLEAQNQAYRHSLANGVSITMLQPKRRWFRLRSD